MKPIRSLLVACVLSAFGASMFGCHTSTDVGTDDHGGTAYKKETTTVRDSNGDTHTKTEVKTSTP